MTTFAITDPAHTIAALNYALSNLNTGNVSGNTTIPGNVLVANTTSNAISTYGSGTIIAYVNEFLNVRYANSGTGSSGFANSQANANYYGVFNTITSTNPGVSNPANYQWFQVTGGFGTTKTLYYLCNGGRQVQLSATTSAPSSGYVPTVNSVPIDLDVVTTANGTPGARGAIAMAYVLTPSDPNTGGNTALSTWFAASRTNLVPPIGTGLTPVSGDTADFLWPTTNASGTYTFDGAGWASAVGQVVAGNTIVNGTITGNTIANSTITGNNIIVGTVSGDVIIANTLAGNTVIANTLYGNAIIANTIYGNAIIANTINGNSIIANTISGNSIIANSFTANSINGSSISAGSIAANTINGASIVSGSITTNQLAANVLTANTVVSTGATIGNFASPGFWLQGSTGNARFGNTVSIGTGLTVGNNASIGGNLTVGSNLSVTGLVTSGSLNANTVQTTTMVPGAVSLAGSYNTLTVYSDFPPAGSQWNYDTQTLTITTPQANQPVYLFGTCQNQLFTVPLNPSLTWALTWDIGLFRRTGSVGSYVYTIIQDYQRYALTNQPGSTGNSPEVIPPFVGYLDIPATAGTYTYLYAIRYVITTNITVPRIDFMTRNILAQLLKR